jgi:hypothetical protein
MYIKGIVYVRRWPAFNCLCTGPVADCYEHGNESVMKGGKFLEEPSKYQFFKKSFAPMK